MTSRATATMALLLALSLAPATLATNEGGATHVDDDLVGLGPAPVSMIVQTTGEPSPEVLDELAGIGTVHYVYSVIDAVHVVAPGDEVSRVAALDDVWRIDADEALAWHLDTSRPAVRVGPPVWDSGLTGTGTTVAVVDTGVDDSHPTFGDRVLTGVTFSGPNDSGSQSARSTDLDGHGTHVAGIVAGSGEGSQLLRPGDLKYAGLAVRANIVSLDISQSFTTSTAIKAFDWIHENREQYGISVVQNSWGRLEVGEPFDPRDPAVRASNALAIDDGLLIVFSAANQGPDPSTLSMEAQNPNVLTVGAVDDAGRVAEFSSRGPVIPPDGSTAWVKPDVVAPGVRIHSAASTQSGAAGLYKDLSGTSQAAPHVAGVAALIRAQAPDLGPAEIMEVLRRTAHDVGAPGPDADTGYGFVDAASALELALETGAEGLQVPTDETYGTSGTLVLDGGTGSASLFGSLLGDSGAATGTINGTLPVKPNATRLAFGLTWTGSGAGPAPELAVTLTGPDGNAVDVPAQAGSASVEVADPAAGFWEWRAEAAGPASAGSIDYDMVSTVTAPAPLSLAGDFGGSSGYFDDSPMGRLKTAFNDARHEFGDQAVFGVLLAIGVLLLLVLVVRIARR